METGYVLSEMKSLNPLKRVNSILTVKVEDLSLDSEVGLNPLKRVNSILTLSM